MLGRHLIRSGALALGVLTLGCGKPFVEQITRLSHEELFRVALREYEEKDWDNAVIAFERLTLNLPARDTLLPRSYWYLARTHDEKDEYLLAAQTYTRLTESFPSDTMADDALLAAGRAYARLWRKPSLDASYAQTALSTLQLFQDLYPSSDLGAEVRQEIDRLLAMLAAKDYETGVFYLRRKAYDPAIIYFKDVIERYPNTPATRDAYLRLVEAYRAINYREEARETCAAFRQAYPEDGDGRSLCGDVAPMETVSTPGLRPDR